MLRPAVQASRLLGLGIDREAELRRDHHLVANRRQRLADDLLVGEGTINLRCVEEGDATLHRITHEFDAFDRAERRL